MHGFEAVSERLKGIQLWFCVIVHEPSPIKPMIQGDLDSPGEATGTSEVPTGAKESDPWMLSCHLIG